MISTIKIPQDKLHRHLVTIPKEIWEGEKLNEGDLVVIYIKKANDKNLRKHMENLIREDCF